MIDDVHNQHEISSLLQVQLHTNLEKKFPLKLLKRWSKNELIVRPHVESGHPTISILIGVSRSVL